MSNEHSLISRKQILEGKIVQTKENEEQKDWDVEFNDMPVESLCVGSILISILIVSAIDKIRPKN